MQTHPPSSFLPFLLSLLGVSALAAMAILPRSLIPDQELPAWRPPAPQVGADAFLVKLMGTHEPLLARHHRRAMAPASITKLLTAFIAADLVSPSEYIRFSTEAKAVVPKKSPVPIGVALTRDDVLRLALVASANDAAYALAEAAGKKFGAQESGQAVMRFTTFMNKTAGAIGMQHSSFQNPTGLDADGHRTDAEDLALLAEYILMHRPELFSLTREKNVVLTFGAKKALYRLEATNLLLGEFPRLIGGKTGLTNDAKGTLLLAYGLPEGKKAIVVILGSEDRFADGRKLLRWLDRLFPSRTSSS
ncbi:MAG: D-alanyl-D-alanine carboxypeptidase [Parcubacteria group bacterium Gr01-1014_66]|nr:MAG: D-alanyl-D-alanine carboxypeptidase [Parcubacteria group bacterium Gr01-1014_66]